MTNTSITVWLAAVAAAAIIVWALVGCATTHSDSITVTIPTPQVQYEE